MESLILYCGGREHSHSGVIVIGADLHSLHALSCHQTSLFDINNRSRYNPNIWNTGSAVEVRHYPVTVSVETLNQGEEPSH